MPITVNNSGGPISTNSTPAAQDWLFNPSSIEIVHYLGLAMPDPVVVATQLKDFIGLSSTQNMNTFEYRAYLGVNNALPVCVVMSGALYTGVNFAAYDNGMQGDMTYTFQNLNLLNPGTYTFTGVHEIRAKNAQGFPVLLGQRFFTVKIKVYSSETPVFNPSYYQFNRTIGSQAETQHALQISAPVWDIKCPPGFNFTPAAGVTIVEAPDGGFIASGAGEKNFNLVVTAGAEPEDLNTNPVHYHLVINGGLLEILVIIIFVQPSGMFIEKESLEFIAYKGISDAEAQQVAIFHNSQYTFELPPFLLMPGIEFMFSGGAGNYTFLPVSADNMEAGTYTGTVKIYTVLTGIYLGSFDVTYTVVGALESPYEPNGFSFTLDNIFIGLQSEIDDTYYNVLLKARVFPFNYPYGQDHEIKFKYRLFQRRQEFNIGRTIHKLMHDVPTFASGSNVTYRPAEVSLELTEKSDANPEYAVQLQLNNIIFVAGINPGLIAGNGILDVNQKPSRLTPSGYTYLNLLVKNSPGLKVYRHRGAQAELVDTITYLLYGIFSIKVDVGQYEARPGDIFEYRLQIGAETKSKYYKIFPKARESNYIIWENEYKLKSALEFTGDYSIKSELENRGQSLMQRLTEVLVKLESNKTSKLIINTGHLLKTDMASVESLCRAKRAGLLFPDGRVINLVPTQKSILNVDNKRDLIAFDVEFEINRAYNEEIYSF